MLQSKRDYGFAFAKLLKSMRMKIKKQDGSEVPVSTIEIKGADVQEEDGKATFSVKSESAASKLIKFYGHY